jgi:DNA-binding winged helix-turn-helix (wHTH) protein/tetratricopeptide (TPR) repeat protein/TolB-like protein
MELTTSNISELREFDRFRLDASALVLWCGDGIVDLPPKAIEVLSLLIERSGEVVSKNDLIEHVWPESFVEEGNLTHQIYELRKAFREYGCTTELIQTVPRRGYRFTGVIKQVYDGGEQITIERHSLSATVIAELPTDDAVRMLPTAPRTFLQKYSLALGMLFILILVAAGFAVWRSSGAAVIASRSNIRSIAVLPLKHFDGSDDESLGLRIADSLITRLGSQANVSIRPTSSISKLTAIDVDPITVGRSLEVDAVIDGRIHRQGDELRLNLQMISVVTGEQIWSGQFDGNRNSLLDLQDLVARSLKQGVDIAGGRSIEKKNPTESSDAYDKYLLGRYHWNTRTAEGFTKAIVFFEQAVTIDPQFAEAFAGLGDAYVGLYDYGIRPAAECIPKARAALDRSILLRPESAEAFSTLSAIQFLYDRDFPAAERSIKRSIELDPNYATARLRYGWYLTIFDRFDEARSELHAARTLDPTSAIVQTNTGYLALAEGRDDEAEAIFNKVIDLNPTFSLPHWYLGGIYFRRGDRGVMLRHYFRAFEIDAQGSSAEIGTVFDSQGEKPALDAWLLRLESDYKENYSPPSNIALIAAIAGNKAKTLEWLEKAEAIRDPWLLQIKYDHEYDFVRDDSRFRSLLERMKLVSEAS